MARRHQKLIFSDQDYPIPSFNFGLVKLQCGFSGKERLSNVEKGPKYVWGNSSNKIFGDTT